MILEIFLGRIAYGPAMGSARHLRRIARAVERAHPGARVVLSPEDGYRPAQLALLAAIAEGQGERDMRELMNELPT